MIIYIRHADKKYSNGKNKIYKHDPPITDSGIEMSHLVASRLVKQYGNPTKIISSPYRRTRETAIEMNKEVFKNSDSKNSDYKIDNIPISCDVDLSEYLGNHPNEKIDVTRETALYHPPHPEKIDDLKKRVSSHIERIFFSIEDGEKIWVITHGLTIITLIQQLTGKKIKSIELLGAVIVTVNHVIVLQWNSDRFDGEKIPINYFHNREEFKDR